MSDPVDYLAIGHVTHDVQPDASLVVGGTVSYAALTAASLRRRAGILTSAGEDFDFSSLGGVAVVNCGAAATTTFRNLYINGRRRQILYSLADPLTPAAVPELWRSAPIVHLGPVINECDPDLIDGFPPTVFIGVTPQGWMRSSDGNGQIQRQPWGDGAAKLLARASAVIFSLDDVEGDWETVRCYAASTRVLVVTMGPLGGVLFVDGKPLPFTAMQVTEVDPTGAGDVFAAVFFSLVASGVQPVAATPYAACLASRSVTRHGPQGVPGDEDFAVCSSLLPTCD
ncbi:MAG: PfkB family carbohydrate kinase [Anaerolineae bacterium]